MKLNKKARIIIFASMAVMAIGAATPSFAYYGSVTEPRRVSDQEIAEIKINTGTYTIKDVGTFKRVSTPLNLPPSETVYDFDDATPQTNQVIDPGIWRTIYKDRTLCLGIEVFQNHV